MESIHTTINKELCIEIFKTKRILSIISIIIGLIGFTISFILQIKYQFNQILGIVLYFIFILMIIGGIAILLTIRKNIKEFDNKTIESDATFYDDYVNIISYNKDIQIEDVKHFYKDLLFFKEKKNIVLVYINKILAIPYTKKEGLVEFLLSKGVKKKIGL